MTLPANVTLIPKAFSALATAINGLLTWAESWDRLKVGTGLKLTKAEGGHLLSVDTTQMAQVMAGNGGGPGGGRFIPFSFTAAGVVPTEAEIETGIETAYSSGGYMPRGGDFLYSTAFHYMVTSNINFNGGTITASGIWRVTFQVDGKEYVAFNIGPNRLY